MKIIKPLTFNPFTFERDSPAKYLDSSGDYTDAANDVLRIGYGYDIDRDTVALRGPIIEDQGYNFIGDSNSFTGLSWEAIGYLTITANSTESPDGSVNASLFVPGESGPRVLRCATMKNFAGATALFSVFLKAATADVSVRLTLGLSTSVFRINVADYWAFEPVIAEITPFPNGWFRCEIYADNFFTGQPTIEALSNKSFFMYGAQLEYGSASSKYVKRATSYVHQDGSAIVNLSGTSVSRVSGTAFTNYTEGQTVTISTNDFVIDTITDASNMTLVASSLTISNALLNPRTYRAPDIVISQTPSLVSSNIAEDDAGVYDNGDTYSIGDTVMVLGEYHRVYESLTNSNTGNFPPDNTIESSETPDWLDTGATNRWRMFDMQVGAEKQSLATVSSGDIDVTMQVDTPVNSVVLLNASGSTAAITMRDGSGEIIYEREVHLLGTAMGIGWWEFFFGYRGGVKTIVLTDLPLIAPATIRVEIDNGGGIAGLGKLIIGEAIDIGCTKFGTTVGIIDFSRKERDAFGSNYILERRYIDKVDYDIQIDSDKVDDVKDILTDLRATPAVYIGSENKFKSTVVYGFYRDFSIVIAGSKKSSCAIQVEGI